MRMCHCNYPTEIVPHDLNCNCLSLLVMKMRKVIRIFMNSQNMISIYKSVLYRM